MRFEIGDLRNFGMRINFVEGVAVFDFGFFEVEERQTCEVFETSQV